MLISCETARVTISEMNIKVASCNGSCTELRCAVVPGVGWKSCYSSGSHAVIVWRQSQFRKHQLTACVIKAGFEWKRVNILLMVWSERWQWWLCIPWGYLQPTTKLRALSPGHKSVSLGANNKGRGSTGSCSPCGLLKRGVVRACWEAFHSSCSITSDRADKGDSNKDSIEGCCWANKHSNMATSKLWAGLVGCGFLGVARERGDFCSWRCIWECHNEVYVYVFSPSLGD